MSSVVATERCRGDGDGGASKAAKSRRKSSAGRRRERGGVRVGPGRQRRWWSQRDVSRGAELVVRDDTSCADAVGACRGGRGRERFVLVSAVVVVGSCGGRRRWMASYGTQRGPAAQGGTEVYAPTERRAPGAAGAAARHAPGRRRRAESRSRGRGTGGRGREGCGGPAGPGGGRTVAGARHRAAIVLSRRPGGPIVWPSLKNGASARAPRALRAGLHEWCKISHEQNDDPPRSTLAACKHRCLGQAAAQAAHR